MEQPAGVVAHRGLAARQRERAQRGHVELPELCRRCGCDGAAQGQGQGHCAHGQWVDEREPGCEPIPQTEKGNAYVSSHGDCESRGNVANEVLQKFDTTMADHEERQRQAAKALQQAKKANAKQLNESKRAKARPLKERKQASQDEQSQPRKRK